MRDHLKAAVAWLLARSQEKSTWSGVVTVAAAIVGHQLGDTTIAAIAFAGPFVGGALIAVTEKHGPGAAITAPPAA